MKSPESSRRTFRRHVNKGSGSSRAVRCTYCSSAAERAWLRTCAGQAFRGAYGAALFCPLGPVGALPRVRHRKPREPVSRLGCHSWSPLHFGGGDPYESPPQVPDGLGSVAPDTPKRDRGICLRLPPGGSSLHSDRSLHRSRGDSRVLRPGISAIGLALAQRESCGDS